MSDPKRCDVGTGHDEEYPCSHDVETYRVVSAAGYDWGLFDYCSNAVDEDRRRGFTVTKEEAPRG